MTVYVVIGRGDFLDGLNGVYTTLELATAKLEYLATMYGLIVETSEFTGRPIVCNPKTQLYIVKEEVL
jgi:hypothetical protein